MKYDPKSHQGGIPSIQVNLRSNRAKGFQAFQKDMISSATQIKRTFPDFSYIEKPTKIIIDGKDALTFVAGFSVPAGQSVIKVKSRTIALPRGSFFYQINFTDVEGEDNSTQFTEALKSIAVR
jgi:hypothetical protein